MTEKGFVPPLPEDAERNEFQEKWHSFKSQQEEEPKSLIASCLAVLTIIKNKITNSKIFGVLGQRGSMTGGAAAEAVENAAKEAATIVAGATVVYDSQKEDLQPAKKRGLHHS